ncbi:MAG TPA: hypothetical protein VFH26_01995 [Gemmatimonadales bacterium]|nr:hypothetical protein [Gemmatimonadales bacterium]
MTLAKCSRVVMAAAVSLLAPAQLESQHLPGSGEFGWRVPADGPTTATTPQLIRWTVAKSPGRALALSTAGTLLPIAAGAIVLATRPRGDPGEPADETYDVVGGILIGVGLGAGPSLGHFYAHEMGWFVPRVVVGGALGLLAAGSDLGSGVGLALLGGTAVTIMAARDIATAPAAARRYNASRLGLSLGLDRARGEGRLGLRLGVAVKLGRRGSETPLRPNKQSCRPLQV